MAMSDSLLPEFDKEMANTRRTLERVPDDKFSWKPHEKSSAMGALASHFGASCELGQSDDTRRLFDLAPGGVPARFHHSSPTRPFSRPLMQCRRSARGDCKRQR
jgi:hypothetical protein